MDYHIPKIDGLPCISPRELADAAAAQGWPADFWGKANSIIVPIGFEPGIGYLLVDRETYKRLSVNQLHTLEWDYYRDGNGLTKTFQKWTICAAKIQGIDGDEKAPYLLTLRDYRQILKSCAVINEAFNVLSPGACYCTDPNGAYLSSTLKGGKTLWTWQQILADLWLHLPSAGTCPTLPWVPQHSPHNWRFHGIQAWDAIRMICEACQTTLMPTGNGATFAAVNFATRQSDAWLTSLRTRIMRDGKPQTPCQCTMPAKLAITFPVIQAGCQEEQYAGEAMPVYEATPRSTGLSCAQANSMQAIRYDLPAVLSNGKYLNQAALEAAAAAIVTRAGLRMAYANPLDVVHSGICPEVTLGQRVHQIVYRDYGDGDNTGTPAGCITESRGIVEWALPTEAWTRPVKEKPQVQLGMFEITGTWIGDCSKGSKNHYPFVTATPKVLYDCTGKVYTTSKTKYTVYHTAGVIGSKRTELLNEICASGKFPAKFRCGDWVWCVYDQCTCRWEVIGGPEDVWRFELMANMMCGSSGQARLLAGAGDGATSVTFTVQDFAQLIGVFPLKIAPAGTRGIAKRFADSCDWKIISIGTCEGCAATGEVILGDGALYGDCGTVCENRVKLSFIGGKLCEVKSVGPVCHPMPGPSVEAGTCIQVDNRVDPLTGCKVYRVSNKMGLVPGKCISIDENQCQATINNTMEITAGDCIEIEGDDCNKIIKATTKVVGGDGIRVDQDGCTFSVSLDGAEGDPKTTLKLLCGVEIAPIQIYCVETSGGWQFVVTGGELTEKFTYLTLPASLFTARSDCETTGVFGCDDCPPGTCTEEEIADGKVVWMKVIGGELTCDCQPAGDAGMIADGWTECGNAPPQGEGLLLNGIACDGAVPHVSFTFLGMPAGATSYTIHVSGSQGSHATIGPSFDHEEVPGQEYWGALNEGFTAPQPGECFMFAVEFKDDSGAVISTQTFTACCP